MITKFKIFEEFNFLYWENIREEDSNLYVDLYSLSHEMEEKADGDVDKIRYYEDLYCDTIRDLLEGKVITLDSEDLDEPLKCVCEEVEFEGGHLPKGDDEFQLEFIHIKFEDENMTYGVGQEPIIVHLNEDPDVYRNTKKYNL
jgi:hypothetical protein